MAKATITKEFMSDVESANRPAWTQTLEGGMGNGLQAFNHKQPHNGSPLKRDHYIKTKGYR
jgi:hypothetical protein